jgi:hypothetical protein
MRLPYRPIQAGHREPYDSSYGAARARVIGFRFWSANMYIYDSWIGEGFSPREVRAILGLSEGTTDEETRKNYVYSTSGEPALETDGFYVP